jgi:hypothetical protein
MLRRAVAALAPGEFIGVPGFDPNNLHDVVIIGDERTDLGMRRDFHF